MATGTLTFNEQVLLEKCREIELKCRDLYSCFADIYSDDMDIVRLWRKTAMEEQNHADQFTLALKLKRGLNCLVSVDQAKVESIIAQLAIVFEKIQTAPPRLEDALLASIKLENYLAEFHLACVVIFEDDSYRKMFNAMMASDQEHIASLQAAYDKMTGVQDWTFTG